MNIIFATCDHQPELTPDDDVLAAALRPLGIDVTAVPWTAIDPYAVVDAPPILLRSTWDYHRVPTMFRAWLASLADSGRTVWNDAAIAQGNIDKIYLQHLAGRGIAMPATRWVGRPEAASIAAAVSGAGWDRAVLKPRIAATAYGTFRLDAATVLTGDDLAPARASGALIQQFVPEIETNGEVSLIYFEGRFSHAVVKRAAAGDYRVQKDFGGSVAPFAPGTALLAFADEVVGAIDGSPLYARVDVVESARGPLLMELELIEPELYFSVVPDAAPRLAAALAARL